MPISPARAAAYDILLRVQQQGAYASELLHSARLEKLTPVDRNLTTEIVMGTLRWQSRLDAAIAANSSRPIAKLDEEVLVALRIAAYQLLYLTRTPAHAAINESVELVKRARKRSAAPFANALLRRMAKTRAGVAGSDLQNATLAQRYSHPEWMVNRWIEHYGIEAAEAICAHDQQIPPTTIRATHPDILTELQDEGVVLAPGKLLASARTIVSGDVTHTRAFREHRVFIQDEVSQLVALLVGTGTRILDCCAAPGSKTALLAEQNLSAKIVAAELHPHRAELLRRRVTAANVDVMTADATALPTSGGFDRVLADVPCSGTGTLARNPEIKWRLIVDDLADLHARQAAILQAALRQLANGGRIVYSTCSLEAEENESVVEEVLRAAQNYRLLDCEGELRGLQETGELIYPEIESLRSGPFLRTIPGTHPGDGFFAAILERLN